MLGSAPRSSIVSREIADSHPEEIHGVLVVVLLLALVCGCVDVSVCLSVCALCVTLRSALWKSHNYRITSGLFPEI